MAHPLDDQTRLSWAPLTRDDLGDLGGLLTAIEHMDEPSERHSPEGLVETFNQAYSDPGRHAAVGRDRGGTLLAYGWNYVQEKDVDPRRVFLTGGVHPGWRHQGIGRAVFGWQMDAARRWYAEHWNDGQGPLQMTCYSDEQLNGQVALYEHMGLRPMRWFSDMTLRFEGEIVDLDPPDGVTVVPFTTDVSERTRLAHNDAFADHWGAQPVDVVSWNEGLARVASRPEWSWVAIEDAGGEVVGYAMNSAYEQDWEAQGFSEGWTDRIGVVRSWRGHGLARTLLTRSMQSFKAAGLDGAGLGVDADSPTGAQRLYQGLGYQATDTMIMYGLIDPAPTAD